MSKTISEVKDYRTQYIKLHKRYQTALYFLNHNSDKNLDSHMLAKVYDKLDDNISSFLTGNLPKKYFITKNFINVKPISKKSDENELQIFRLNDHLSEPEVHLSFDRLNVKTKGDVNKVIDSVVDSHDSIEYMAKIIKQNQRDDSSFHKFELIMCFVGVLLFILSTVTFTISPISFVFFVLGVLSSGVGIMAYSDNKNSVGYSHLRYSHSHISVKTFMNLIKSMDNKIVNQIKHDDKILENNHQKLLPYKHAKAIKNGKFSWDKSVKAINQKRLTY